MSKRKHDDTKPFSPLRHEFVASLDRYVIEAGMLADSVQTVLTLGAIDQSLVEIIQGRLRAFNIARFGDEYSDV